MAWEEFYDYFDEYLDTMCESAYYNLDNGLWVTREGVVHHICDMTPTYIQSCIRWLEENGANPNFPLDEYVELFRKTLADKESETQKLLKSLEAQGGALPTSS